MKKLWFSFAVVFSLSFAVLGWIGTRVYQQMPPIPRSVVSTDGTVLLADGDIGKGKNVWQALGGMEVGSVWGHGSYVAPDWTADWLHRETSFVLEEWASQEFGASYGSLSAENQAKLRGRLEEMYRKNGYDPATSSVVIEPVRARAFESCLQHFSSVFMSGEKAYAIPAHSVDTPEHMRQFAGFIFWSAWAAAANRPGDSVSYTHNWPYEPFVGNRPTGESVLWTGVSIIMLQVELNKTQQDLAAELGTVRELVSRNFARLQAEGYLDVNGRSIIVKDLPGLQREQESPQ